MEWIRWKIQVLYLTDILYLFILFFLVLDLLLYQIDDIFNYHNCGHPASLAF